MVDSANFLDTTRMRTASGDYVPLADIVNVETRSGFSTIRRENGIRVVSVFGDISEDDPARAVVLVDYSKHASDPFVPQGSANFWQ